MKRKQRKVVRLGPGDSGSVGPVRIDRKWAWHYRRLLALRRQLDPERAAHQSEAMAPREEGNADFGDVASDESQRRLILAEVAAEENLLGEIEAALERLRTGTYGRCEKTGKPIAADRLRAVPWTRFSREAERGEEATRGRRS